MQEIQKLDYNGQKVRTTRIEGQRWWALCDVCRVIDCKNHSNYSGRLSESEKKMIIVENSRGFGGVRMIFVSDAALYRILNHSYKVEAAAFQSWLTSEIGVDFSDAQNPSLKKPSSKSTGKSSAEASIQKAQMLIRIAEHKAVPYEEQLRLLDLAVKELTSAGLSAKNLLKGKQTDSEVDDIMKLPEVVGIIPREKYENVNGCTVKFCSAGMMARKWWYPKTGKGFDAETFNQAANEQGFKKPQFGFWGKSHHTARS